MPSREPLSRARRLLAMKDFVGLRELTAEHPAILNARTDNADGFTLLHIASKAGELDQVRFLLDLGADPTDRTGMWQQGSDLRDRYYDPGLTAMMLAARAGHKAVVQLLFERGASVNDTGHRGETAILFAAIAGAVGVAEFLLANGAAAEVECGVKLFDKDLGWHFVGTPMHAAAEGGHDKLIKCLLNHGAIVDPKIFPCERTPLFYAVANGHIAATVALLSAGANPKHRENRQVYNRILKHSPLDYALVNGHEEIAQLLRNAGAQCGAKSVITGKKSRTGRQFREADMQDWFPKRITDYWDQQAEAITTAAKRLEKLSLAGLELALAEIARGVRRHANALSEQNLLTAAFCMTDDLYKAVSVLSYWDPSLAKYLNASARTLCTLLYERGFVIRYVIDNTFSLTPVGMSGPLEWYPMWFSEAGFKYICPQHLALSFMRDDGIKTNEVLERMPQYIDEARMVTDEVLLRCQKASDHYVFLDTDAAPTSFDVAIKGFGTANTLTIFRDDPPVRGTKCAAQIRIAADGSTRSLL